MFELTPFYRNNNRHNELNVYDPFRELDQLEKAFFGQQSRLFCTDVIDNGDSYTIEAELPGFKKEDIKIDITGETMNISAEHSTENKEEDKKRNYVRVERSSGSYSRSFDLSGINAEGISAEYKDGVLSVTLPKQEPKSPETRRLEIA